jgi:hypothetical protein
MNRILLGFAALLLAPACGAQSRSDTDSFAADMARRLSKATGREFVITGTLSLRVKGSKPDGMTIFLDRIYQYCQHNSAEDCEHSKADFANSTSEAFTEVPAISADRLRIVVRDSEYCAQITTLMAGKAKPPEPGKTPLNRPFAEGLCTALMVDYPRTRKSVSQGDLNDLKLGTDAAWELARKQTVAVAPKLAGVEVGSKQLVVLEGGDYVPSVLLDLEGWRALAARTKGDLIVTVPDENFATILADLKSADLPRFQKMTRESYDAAERGISPFVYRWNGSGWTVVR